MTKIYTNLNFDNMYNELKKHYKNIKNKEYIKNSLTTHYNLKMINEEEFKKLKDEFIK